jgi:tartrate dehydratase beta subunit/fumarate hydratase class I family protein
MTDHPRIRSPRLIGKGGMGDKTLATCKEHACVYFHGVGGSAQVLAECVKKVRNVYFLKEFGSSEAIWELEVERFPRPRHHGFPRPLPSPGSPRA